MSSSDEAPEEATFSESKFALRLQEKKQRQAEEASRHASKQKRRDRDQKLKQQGSHKKKLLSEILQESDHEDEEQRPQSEIEQAPSVPVSQPKREKKTFAVKDGYTVKVSDARVSKNKKRLPPPAAAAANRREEFLFRESVPRK